MQHIKQISSFIPPSLALLYTIAYLLWRGLLLSPLYEISWQLQLSEIFGAWIYLPLLPLIALVVLTRRWRAVAALCIPLAFFAWEYGAQFLPNWQHGWTTQSAQAQAQPVDDDVLSVLTWNTLISSTVQDDLHRILTQETPDIVTLQEVSYSMRRTLNEEYAQRYPYQYYQSTRRLITLSRYPLTNAIPDDELMLYGCRCLPLEIVWKGRALTIINIHLPSPDVRYSFRSRIPRVLKFDASGQDLYYQALFKLLDQIEGPILLQGDINTTERQPHFKQLTQTLTDSFAEAGWGMGFTYPNSTRRGPAWLMPLIQIDHILHSEELVALTAQTEQLRRSDHRAVRATLRWRE